MKPRINLKAAKKSLQDLNLKEDFITHIISAFKTINKMSEDDYNRCALSIRVYCDNKDEWSTDKLGHLFRQGHLDS